nr:MAG TPA: hypothetical protein [Microviridae sp.]
MPEPERKLETGFVIELIALPIELNKPMFCCPFYIVISVVTIVREVYGGPRPSVTTE